MRVFIFLRRFTFPLAVLALTASAATAQTSTWIPDKSHSEVDFSVLHLSLTNVRGRFNLSDGAIEVNDADISKSSVKMTIDVSSEDSGSSGRDSALKGSSFFDIEQFPTATFVSTSVAKTATGLAVNGNLTVKGITKPVTLNVEGPNGPVKGMDNKLHAGWSATTTLNRTDFQLGSSYPAAAIGDDVKLEIDMEVVKQ
jgi:polyisoprenoid-binding protein YceI